MSSSLETVAAGGSGVLRLAAGLVDTDGDGNPDLVLTDGDTDRALVLAGDGSGRFTSGTSASELAYSAVLADLDGDGLLDLALTDERAQDSALLFGDGTSTFLVPSSFEQAFADPAGTAQVATAQVASGAADPTSTASSTLSAPPSSAPTGQLLVAQSTDLDGDGRADLVLTDVATGAAGAFLRREDGSFATQPGPDGTVYTASLIQFDGDGLVDLALSDQATGIVSFLLGDGAGGFSPLSRFVSSAPEDRLAARFEDLDLDGIQDLVLSNVATASSLAFLGNGAGTYLSRPDAGGQVYSANFGDLDGDGLVDLALAEEGTGSVALLLGDGAGEFGLVSHDTPAAAVIEIGAVTARVGDLDADGIPDLTVTDLATGTTAQFAGLEDRIFGLTQDGVSYRAELMDANENGVWDLIMSDSLTGTMSLLLGDGTGTFTPVGHLVVAPSGQMMLQP